MAVLTGPGNLSPQFTVANDGLVSLTNPPLPATGGTVTGPVVIKTNTAPTLPAPPAGTLLQLGAADALGTRIVANAFGASSTLHLRAAAGTALAPTPLPVGNSIGFLNFDGYGTTGYGTGAYIGVFANQNWTDAARGALMTFNITANGAPNPTEVMRIADSGNVGIGKTSPVSKLDVMGDIHIPNNFALTGNLYYNAGWKFSEATGLGGGITFAAAEPAIMFNVASGNTGVGSAATQLTPMVITATGNVGIGSGVGVPSLKLDVRVNANQHIGFNFTGSNPTIVSFNDNFASWLPLEINPGGNIYLCSQAGNVGIGTAGPGSRLEVTDTGGTNGGPPVISILPTSSTAAGTIWASASRAANLTANSRVIHLMGKSNDSNNAGYVGFRWNGAAFTTNGVTFGVWGNDDMVNIMPGGVTIGAPAGGGKGLGTLNVIGGVYSNNVLLTSDANLKTDIEPIPQDCLGVVSGIEPKTFKWKSPALIENAQGEMRSPVFEGFSDRLNRGFLAQDVVKALGGKVEDGVDLGGMVAVLWQAVRELSADVAARQGEPMPTPTPRT